VNRPSARSLTRRAPRPAVALVAVLALGACAATPGAEPGAGSAPSTSTTRVVATERGDVEIPADPQRVAVVDWQLPPALVDLGVEPVAIYEGYYEQDVAKQRNLPARYVDALASAQRFGTWDALSFEELATAEPDLVVTTATGLEEPDLERLEQIAPLVVLSPDGGWQDMQRRVAEVLDREDEYAALADAFEERAQEVGEAHQDVLAATSWVSVSGAGEQWFVEGGATPTGTLLRAVGATLDDVVDPEGYWSEGYSFERVGDLSGADVVLYPAGPDGGPSAPASMLVQQQLFQDLPAVAAGNAFAFSAAGVSCLGWAADGLDELDGLLGEVTVP
jgi:iron complex transport system substrate-binding protein